MKSVMQATIEAPPAIVRVAVVAPYPSSRAGLRALVEQDESIRVAFEESSLPPQTDMDTSFDALIVDLADSDEIRPRDISPPAVILLDESARDLQATAGLAFLHRDATAGEVVAALNAVIEGLAVIDAPFLSVVARSPRLVTEGTEQITDRELDVLRLVADGLTNKAIARQLGISDHTVKFHVGAILAKLGAESRTEAVSRAARSGLLPL
jgi:DNA-binding NarL/FixJ family response regulator